MGRYEDEGRELAKKIVPCRDIMVMIMNAPKA